MMVVNLKSERKCDRCGATKKEDVLTRSHSPHRKLLKMCSFPAKERAKFMKIYTLCEMCRLVHQQLEERIMAKACLEMTRLHKDYINQ